MEEQEKRAIMDEDLCVIASNENNEHFANVMAR